jgi:hypothetical protein
MTDPGVAPPGAEFQYDCLPFDVAQLSERLPKHLYEVLAGHESAGENATNPGDSRLRLCRASERPPDHCAAEKCDELTPLHPIPPIYADARVSDGARLH